MAREEDYYSILGVDRNAPDREIKRAYYRLARELHPDRAKTPDEARANAEQLAVISKAYNSLKDPQKRAAYDAGSAGKRGAPPPPPSAGPTSINKASTNVPGITSPAPAPPASPSSTRMTAPATVSQQRENKVQTTAVSDSNRLTANEIAQQRVVTAQKAFVRGMQLYKNNEYKQAVPFLEAAAQNDPDSEPHYHMKLAVALVKSKGSFTRAVEAAEKACQMDAYNMDFKIGLAEIYEQVGILSKAIEVYKEVLKWDPDHERAKFRLQLAEKSEAASRPPSGLLEKVFPSFFKKK